MGRQYRDGDRRDEKGAASVSSGPMRADPGPGCTFLLPVEQAAGRPFDPQQPEDAKRAQRAEHLCRRDERVAGDHEIEQVPPGAEEPPPSR